jgi:hypothetical protein
MDATEKFRAVIAEAERRGIVIDKDTDSKCMYVTISNPRLSRLDYDDGKITWFPDFIMGMVQPGQPTKILQMTDVTHLPIEELVKTVFG